MLVAIICENCGTPASILYKNKQPRFCGAKCRNQHWEKNNKEYRNSCVRSYRARRYVEEGSWRCEGEAARGLAAWMAEIKSKPCTDCGGTFPICCMDFDHKHDAVKAYNIGSMFAHHYSRELIQTELDKCELVCSNCHRIRTRDRRKGSGMQHQLNVADSRKLSGIRRDGAPDRRHKRTRTQDIVRVPYTSSDLTTNMPETEAADAT